MTQEELLDRLAVMADRIAEQASVACTERSVKEAMVVFGPTTAPDEIKEFEREVNAWIADGWQPYGFAWEQGGMIKLVMVKR